MSTKKRAGSYPALFATPLRAILFALFFLYIFIYFGKIYVWDIDFWWHLSTGRYIVENLKLPVQDPFSYTTALPDSFNPAPGREGFILTQYWLSQAIIYLVHKAAGFSGIKALRAALLTLTSVLLFVGMKRKSVSLPVAYLFSAIFFIEELSFTGERPQLFSFAFSVLTVLILEEARSGRLRPLYLLPLVTLVWSNMHGGFIMGDFLIGMYIATELVKYRLGDKFNPLSAPVLRRLSALGGIAILTSFINPNAYRPIPQTLLVEKYFSSVQELLSPFHFYMQKITPVEYHYILLLAFALIAIVSLGRRDLTASLLTLSLAALSLKSSRYTIFFAGCGIFFIAPEIDRLLERASNALRLRDVLSSLKKYLAFEWAAAVLIFFMLTGEVAGGGFFTQNVYSRNTPVKAADFIKTNNIPGPMFNSYEFGGYLIWALYPEKKVFIDSRGLKIGVCKDYTFVMNAMEDGTVFGLPPERMLWEETLNKYGINFAVLPFLNYRGDIYPINLALIESPKWTLIYSDHLANIFVRNAETNRDLIAKHAKPKEAFYASIIYNASFSALQNRINPSFLTTLGEVFEKAGRADDARKAYRFALERDPGNESALAGLRRLNDLPRPETTNAAAPSRREARPLDGKL